MFRWRRSRSTRPRIVVLVENLPLARDRRLEKQTRTLAAAGYDVTVICRRDPGNRAIPGVRVAEYPAPRDAESKLGFVREYALSWLLTALVLARVAVRPGFDLLVTCAPPDLYFPFRVFGRPVVYDQRDSSPELYASRYGSGGRVAGLLRLLERASYRSADHVIVANGSFARLARTRGGVPAARVTVVGNGPVLAATAPRPPRPELRAGRAHLCCGIGAMGPQDRLDLGVRVVHHLVHKEGRTDCGFAFVGDGEARADAVRLAAELGVSDWVSFPGFLPQEEVFDYLATADVGIDPGLDDTVAPVKAVEYMAFRLPFVAFDLREVSALAGGAARYAPPGDVGGFAELVADLLDDPVARARLGAVGRSRVETSLAWDHQAVPYLAVFDALLRGEDRVRGR
jgi:glycosyltransferase involved in cell wall biosynthesis